jgi:starvation-inducible DNA-binding protein
MTQTMTFPTRVGLASDVRQHMVELLNAHLADTFDLYTQSKQAHWNLKGMHFIALHKLFDDLAENLEDTGDMIAERVTALGGMAMGTARMAAANSRLPEMPLDLVDGKDYVIALADRFGQYGNSIRAAIDTATNGGDLTTADLFTEISRDVDKHLYFLEAHLQA